MVYSLQMKHHSIETDTFFPQLRNYKYIIKSLDMVQPQITYI